MDIPDLPPNDSNRMSIEKLNQAYYNTLKRLELQKKPKKEDAKDALYTAITIGDFKTINTLLDHNTRLNDYVFTAVQLAKNPAIFQLLLDRGWGVDTAYDGQSALCYVIDSKECVQLLLDNGADPNFISFHFCTHSLTPLAFASACESTEVVDMLFAKGAKPDPEALFGALDRGSDASIPMVECLIRHGMDVNQQTDKDGTPIIYITSMGRWEQAEALLEMGADPLIQDVHGRNAIDVANEKGFLDMQRLFRAYLRGKKYCINTQMNEYYNPLHNMKVVVIIDLGRDI